MTLKDILMFILSLLNLTGSFNFLRDTLTVPLKFCVRDGAWVWDFTKISDTPFKKLKDLRMIGYLESSFLSSLPCESYAFYYHAVCWFKQGDISVSQQCSNIYLICSMSKYLFWRPRGIHSWTEEPLCVTLRKSYLVMSRNTPFIISDFIATFGALWVFMAWWEWSIKVINMNWCRWNLIHYHPRKGLLPTTGELMYLLNFQSAWGQCHLA